MIHKLKINGKLVLVTYLQMGGGHVCQLLIEDSLTDEVNLHKSMMKALSQHFPQGGYMDNLNLSPHTHPDVKRSKLFSEIRLAGATMVWVVDTLRNQSFEVVEEDPLF